MGRTKGKLLKQILNRLLSPPPFPINRKINKKTNKLELEQGSTLSLTLFNRLLVDKLFWQAH
jgi:hypothetical protein